MRQYIYTLLVNEKLPLLLERESQLAQNFVIQLWFSLNRVYVNRMRIITRDILRRLIYPTVLSRERLRNKLKVELNPYFIYRRTEQG